MITFLIAIQIAVMIASVVFAVIIHIKNKAIINAYNDQQTAFLDDNDLSESGVDIQHCEQPFISLY